MIINSLSTRADLIGSNFLEFSEEGANATLQQMCISRSPQRSHLAHPE